MGSNIVLYWDTGLPLCWRLMITLHEKGITDYHKKLVSYEKKEHKSEEILKLSPRGQIPILKIGDTVICESLAGCVYLETVYGNQGYKLIPDDPGAAKVFQRMYEMANLTKCVSVGIIHYQPEDGKKDVPSAIIEKAREELRLWETHLEQEGDGSHIAGKKFSMADIAFFPHLAWYIHLGFNPGSRFPRLKAYYEMAKQRPSIEATWTPLWRSRENQTPLSDV